MGERMVSVGELQLWTQSFGVPSDDTILLVNGPATGLSLPDELCSELSAGGRHVIRYDHRDTGASTTVDFSQHPYTLSDLAADAIGVLDAYGVAAAHLVGFSMGGMIAQTAALEHPERVASLTSWGSTPLGASFFAAGASDLPGPEEKVLVALAGAATDDPADLIVTTLRSYCGSLEPFDEERTRGLAQQWQSHTRDPRAFTNHWLAGAASPDRTGMLGAVRVPTMVIHGSVDPVVPLPHGVATVSAIPGARLLEIDGMGHDFPRVALPTIVRAILQHTARPDGVTA